MLLKINYRVCIVFAGNIIWIHYDWLPTLWKQIENCSSTSHLDGSSEFLMPLSKSKHPQRYISVSAKRQNGGLVIIIGALQKSKNQSVHTLLEALHTISPCLRKPRGAISDGGMTLKMRRKRRASSPAGPGLKTRRTRVSPPSPPAPLPLPLPLLQQTRWTITETDFSPVLSSSTKRRRGRMRTERNRKRVCWASTMMKVHINCHGTN